MKLKYNHQRYVFIYGCLLIPLLFFLLVRILPIFYSFNVSFHEWDLLSETKPFVGLNNFKFVLQDEDFHASLRNTFIYVFVGVPGQLLVGLIVALLLQRITRLRGLFRTLYFIPYVTSIVAVSWVFRWILMPNGAANSILLQLGLSPQLFLGTPDQAIYVIIGTMIWQAIGFQMLVFLTGLEGIPTLYYEAAEIDGAGSWQKFRKITLPLLNSTIVFSVVIASINFLQTFTQVKNMSPGGTGGPLDSTKTLVLYIYQLAFKSYKMGEAAAATVLLFAIILVLSLIQLKVLSKKVEY
ncbi:sugar ABC transporter permease [Paenibacillus sp. SYP-B3998]|uniref:Sugar ABC transporter permease n=1 Tax=Paenibacillus sp. SYP-B3998 TaxID=2678564 RepID=A0A6G4A530_9BACL|nr:sugar ABC transporter permease [Paenibacillus sp. SYP-B3998]NEW09482.1 sugar ABC transporter permease [Paenibacillus sp. SYP-B3998]